MPGLVPPDVLELSGFCIGCAEKSDLIDPTTLALGDVLIGYESNSIHANGWSLVRRALKDMGSDVVTDEELHAWLEPTRLYDDVVNDLKKSGVKPKAYSHITGGGLPENLERLFVGMGADLEIPKWNLPGIEKLLEQVDAEDRFHTFNMGIGWVAIVSENDVDAALKAGPGGHVLGKMVSQEGVRVKVTA
jgi:phosphoribosylformylglycinamidine cyclo-ligase